MGYIGAVYPPTSQHRCENPWVQSKMIQKWCRTIYTVCIYIYRYTLCIYVYVSADPGPSHGRGGAWNHLWCGPWLFPIYAPIASIAIAFRLLSLQTLRGTTSTTAPRNHLYRTAPELPDTPPPWAPNAPNPPQQHLWPWCGLQLAIPANAPRHHLYCTAPKLPDTPRPEHKHSPWKPYYGRIENCRHSAIPVLKCNFGRSSQKGFPGYRLQLAIPANAPRHHLYCTAPKLPDTPCPGPPNPPNRPRQRVWPWYRLQLAIQWCIPHACIHGYAYILYICIHICTYM